MVFVCIGKNQLLYCTILNGRCSIVKSDKIRLKNCRCLLTCKHLFVNESPHTVRLNNSMRAFLRLCKGALAMRNYDEQLNIDITGGGSFYMLPRALFTMDSLQACGNDAKLLYALMLDRSQLSRRNGWIDDQGRAYIFFTIESVMKLLNVGKTKSVSLFKELESFGLIVREKDFRSTKIYVRTIGQISDVHTDMSSTDFERNVEKSVERKLKDVECEMLSSDNAFAYHVTGSENEPHSTEIRTSKVQKTNPIYTEYIYTESAISSIRQADEKSVSDKRQTDGRKAAKKKSFEPDIKRERSVLKDLKARCGYDKQFSSDETDIVMIELQKFTDSLLRSFVGILCHPSFRTDEQGEFLDADDSGYGYANYLKAQELKEKITEHERRGGLFSWIMSCFERWNGLVNAKKERGEPILRKDRYFPKFLESFLKGEYDLDAVDSSMLGRMDKKYAARSTFDSRKNDLDFSGYIDVRGGRPFEMPDSIFTPFGREKQSMTKQVSDEYSIIRAEEAATESRKQQALDKLMRYGS